MSSSYVTNTAQAACIKHLSYDPKKRIPTATKQGWYIFDGNAYDFPLWEFKLNLKLKCLPRDDEVGINKIVNELIDSLRGNALMIARSIGVDIVMSKDNPNPEPAMPSGFVLHQMINGLDETETAAPAAPSSAAAETASSPTAISLSKLNRDENIIIAKKI